MIFAFIQNKGGVGKSTLAVNTAAGLARAGLKVLIVDADGQGTASAFTGIEPHDGLYQLLALDQEFPEVLMRVPEAFNGPGALWLLSSWTQNEALEKSPETPGLIVERFKELRGAFDAVVVDTSPSRTEIHAGIYYAADFVLLPTLLDMASTLSLGAMLGFLEVAQVKGEQAGYRAAQVLGIVPNMFAGREALQRETLGWLKGKYEAQFRVFDFLRNLTVWRQAAADWKSIYEFKPDDAKATVKALDELSPVVAAMQGVIARPTIKTSPPAPLQGGEGSEEREVRK